MASAAAVGANIALSPEPPNLAEPDTAGGTVSSAIVPPDEDPDDLLDDDDVVKNVKRRNNKVAAEEEELSEAGLDEELFGGDEELPEEAAEPRQLDDSELDSGDDDGRVDRVAAEEGAPAEMETREEVTEYPDFGRQPLPEPSDGEMYLMKVPRFMAVEPQMFNLSSFAPPPTDHHSRDKPSATFSAYSTALSTLRWRHSPSNPEDLQSNARILRWSDGSLTLQLASDPTQQYEIDGNPLAPPQRNPVKPTPTSVKAGQKDTHGHDSFTYLALPNETVGLLRMTHKITAGLSILPSATTTDDALERLQSSLAAAVRGKNAKGDGGIEMVKIDEDPELGRKKAEVAEREKQRAQKRREAAETRERDRSTRTLGRAGLGASRFGAGGLTAGMLEDDEMGGAARPRGKTRPKRARRANSEYSEDEEFGAKRGNFAQDEYDMDDGFLAGSDEEEEDADEDEDEDDGIVEQTRAAEPRRSKPPPARAPSADDEEADASGEPDDDVVQAARGKRRRVIDEDDEDDE